MIKPMFFHMINVQYPHVDNALHVVEGEKLGGGLSRTHKYFFRDKKTVDMNRGTVQSF